MVEQSFAQKIYKLEVHIKTCHVIYDVSCNLNSKDLSIGKHYVEQGLKVTTLQLFFF